MSSSLHMLDLPVEIDSPVWADVSTLKLRVGTRACEKCYGYVMDYDSVDFVGSAAPCIEVQPVVVRA